MKPETRLPFGILCSVPFVMVLSNSMLIPVLPAMQDGMNLSFVQVSLIITAFSVPAGLVIPFAGLGADYLGRRLIMIPALFLFGLGGLIAGVAPLLAENPYGLVLTGRVVQGVGGGGTYQIALALAGDMFQSGERSKAMGLLEAANGLGKVVSPIIGATVALLVWYAPFFVYPVLAWASATGIWLAVKEPPSRRQEGHKLSHYVAGLGRVLSRKGVGLGTAFFSGMVLLFVLFGVLSWYSDVLERDWDVSGFTKGLVIAIPVLAMALTAWLAGTYLQQRMETHLRAIIAGGLGLVAGSLVAVFFFRSLYPTSAAITVLGIGTGMVLPVLNTLTTSAARQERGLVTALYGTVRFFGAALGPPVFGLLVKAGPAANFLGPAALALIGLAGSLTLLDTARFGLGKKQQP